MTGKSYLPGVFQVDTWDQFVALPIDDPRRLLPAPLRPATPPPEDEWAAHKRWLKGLDDIGAPRPRQKRKRYPKGKMWQPFSGMSHSRARKVALIAGYILLHIRRGLYWMGDTREVWPDRFRERKPLSWQAKDGVWRQ